MNNEFTKKLGEWLNTPSEVRDLAKGAMLLLKLTGNRIQYASISLNLAKYADFIEYNLQKHYNYRVSALTLEELKEMQLAASVKAQKIGISEKEESASEESAKFAGYGKRPDHDDLPSDIQQLYADNLEIRRKMQQLHLQIRTKFKEITDCTASDVYALVKEILRYEKLYLKNWDKYDSASREEQ